MHLGIVPENVIERVALAAGVVPEPLLQTQMAFTMAKSIMAATELGVFEALSDQKLTAKGLATKLNTNERATHSLIQVLVGLGYLKLNSDSTYELTRLSRRWLLKSSPHSMVNKMLFQNLEWDIVNQLPQFVRTGKPLQMHSMESKENWSLYQGGMTDIGRLALGEAVARTPIPKGAREMLDIGGSGGTYSAAFVKKHEGLRSTILELPAAYEFAKPFVEEHRLGDRLSIKAGDVLKDDLGENKYDVIFMANVAHHFSNQQNIEVTKKCARALRNGGRFIVHEIIRNEKPSRKNQMGLLLDLYFAMTSQSGTWSVKEISAWLNQAGLKLGKPVYARSAPGLAQVWGEKT